MIPIRRGEEPDELRQARWWRLARARAARRTSAPISFEGYAHATVKDALYARQHQKCAYCDMFSESIAQPIEHFRPKSGVTGPPLEPHHYWWLAWRWDNLFFACVTCNSPTFKGNHFPRTGAASAELTFDLSPEGALLIEPAQQHPMDYIQFRDDGIHWSPFPRIGISSEREAIADKTIKVLGLNRAELLGSYNEHVKRLTPSLDLLESALLTGDEQTRRQAWERALIKLLGSPLAPQAWCTKPLAALTWDVIDQRFSRARREQLNLPLPRPGSHLPADLPVQDLPWTRAQARLHEETRWAIRAIGPANSKDHSLYLERALLALLGDPMLGDTRTAASLHQRLHVPLKGACSKASVQAALNRLRDSNRITCDAEARWHLSHDGEPL